MKQTQIQIVKNQEAQFDQKVHFKFMVASDIHLGYKEKHQVRGEDSFNAFEEIINEAKRLSVDFLLLAGDLFHESNPSQNCLIKCIQTLQKNILGSNDISFEIQNYQPNYQDQNLNIELPIFSIHGNHDAPSLIDNISILDLLHVGKYINFFGKQSNNESLVIEPILLKKNDITIALYGIGYMKDSKFFKLLKSNKVQFKVAPNQSDSLFNILVIHQNRHKGNQPGAAFNQCVHPQQFPEWFDLIIWGHEHECIGEIEQIEQKNISIYQPGSTVSTSLIEAEQKPKGFGIFNIGKSEYNFTQHYLKESFRPVMFMELELSEIIKQQKGIQRINLNYDDDAQIILVEKITSLLDQYEKSRKGDINSQTNKKLPLIRIKIEYSGMDIVRIQQLETQFKDQVANPGEILKFWKRKEASKQKMNINGNTNLNENFENCLKNKQSLNIFEKEANNEILQIYEDDMKKYQYTLIPKAMILDSINQLNITKRETEFEQLFDNIISKVTDTIVLDESKQHEKINTDFQTIISQQMKQIEENIIGNNNNADKNEMQLETDKNTNNLLDNQFEIQREINANLDYFAKQINNKKIKAVKDYYENLHPSATLEINQEKVIQSTLDSKLVSSSKKTEKSIITEENIRNISKKKENQLDTDKINDEEEKNKEIYDSDQDSDNHSDSDFDVQTAAKNKFFQKSSKRKVAKEDDKNPLQHLQLPPLKPDPNIIKQKRRQGESNEAFKQANNAQQTLLQFKPNTKK